MNSHKYRLFNKNLEFRGYSVCYASRWTLAVGVASSVLLIEEARKLVAVSLL